MDFEEVGLVRSGSGSLRAWSRILASAGLTEYAFGSKVEAELTSRSGGVLNLQPGEWVEVRSAREIFATLDGRDELRGLHFARARGSQNTLREKKTIAEDDGIEMAVAVFEEYEESKN